MAGASGGPLGFLSVMSEYRRSRMCDHRWLNSRLTGLRSHFGHWLCSGRTVVWTSRLKEQVVLAVTCLLARCPNKQITNCFTQCATHAEPSAV